MAEIAVVALGYVLGSMPWGLWLPRLLTGQDVRALGSGNVGAANVWRSLGFKLALGVALLDIGKGLAAALVGKWLAGEVVAVLAGFAAMVGHWRPLFLRLARGGKVVATTGGVALALAPLAALAAAAVWIVLFLVTRFTSVASMLAALSLPFLAFALHAQWPVLVFTGAAAAAILVLHRSNLARLARGEENRFVLRRRSPRVAAPVGREPTSG